MLLKGLKVPVWIYIMGAMKDNLYPSQISKEFGITYSHVVEVVKELEKDGFIKTYKLKGSRTRTIKLTDKGNETVVLCQKLLSFMNRRA